MVPQVALLEEPSAACMSHVTYVGGGGRRVRDNISGVCWPASCEGGGPAAPHSQVGCRGQWVAVGSWGAFGPPIPRCVGGVPPPTPPGKFYKHIRQGALLLGVAPLQNVLHGLTLVQFFIRILVVQILSSSISAAEILFARSACEWV